MTKSSFRCCWRGETHQGPPPAWRLEAPDAAISLSAHGHSRWGSPEGPGCYHIFMKLFCALALTAASALAGINPHLKQVNKVYILGMSGGMDQYLANRLTSMGVFQVVADPQKADAIITDRLGEPFEAKLKELYPPPTPVKKEKAKDDKKDDKGDNSKAATSDNKDDKDSGMEGTSGVARVTSFAKGRGNFFIVDPKSSSVLWSVYDPPKDSTPSELSKTAERVVRRLKSDLSEKKQSVE